MTTTDRTLLGHLLIERNLISREQLDQAIRLQKQTQRQLGQILVEQNLISERQIRRLLHVQKRLRTTLLTSILSLTPFALQGCGGGAAAAEDTAMIITPSMSQQVTPTLPDNSVVSPSVPVEAPSSGGSSPIIPLPDAIQPAPVADAEPPAPDPVVETPTSETVAESPTSEPDVSTPDAAIRIHLQPQSQVASAGTDLTLNVSAEGPGILHYQWYRDNIPVSDAVLSSLTLRALTPADSGQYHVRITSDLGTLDSAKADIEVAVQRQARLRWQAPIEREDGSMLPRQEISGYRVYHAIAERDFETTYDVSPEELEMLLEQLEPGLHYFAISAIDAQGLESGLSNLVTKRVL